MSDIPKSKRAYSNLEAHHKALEIRRKIAVELLASFAYSEKKLEEAVRKQTQHIQDPEHRAEAAQAIRNLEEDFACWFIKRHRDRVDDLCCDIAQHLRGANTIMSTTTVMPTTGTPRTPSASARISQLHKVIGQVPACSNGKGEAILPAEAGKC